MSDIDYRFNNGLGAVLCRECRIIIDERLSWDEAKERWTGKDLCDECKEKKIDKEKGNA